MNTMREELLIDVVRASREFAYQHRYMRREHYENICLAIARVYIEIACAEYRTQMRLTWK